MKICHVSSAPFNGGAQRAGLRLHQGLCRTDGIESLWLDAGGLPDAPCAKHLDAPSEPAPLGTRIRRLNWRRNLLRRFAGTKTPFSNPFGWGNPSILKNIPVPEVWNLHWVSHFLDWEHLLPWMAEQAPIVWTLHDMNPLMGVWHYVPFDEEWTAQRRQMEQEAVEFKRNAISRIPKDRLTFVGPSVWMAELCRQSPVTQGFPAIHIPYGLDTKVFTPKDKMVVRSMFGIPSEMPVIGFVADIVTDPRKGMPQLESAIRALPSSLPVHVLTVGHGHAPAFSVPHNHLGPLQSDVLLSFFYSACDAFICPSLQDNLPNTVLESMACGTPVIAYQTGGLPDMVRNGQSGAVVKPVADSEALATAISNLLSNPKLGQELRGRARAIAVAEYELGVQSRCYMELYESMRGRVLASSGGRAK